MFRRSRFSVRPNVGTTGRTAATSQEAPSSNQEATETPRDTSASGTPTAVTDTTPAVTPSVTASGDGGDHIVESSSSSAAVQRRKRFSVKPKVAPGRLSTIGRTPKTPIKSVSETPVEVPISDLDKPTTSSQTETTAAPQGLQSPKRRRPSEDGKQPKVTLTPSDSSGSPTELLQKTNLTPDSGKQSQRIAESQVQDAPPKPQDKVLFSIPDKETVEISEKAKTLVSSKSGRTLTQSTSLSKLLNDPADLQRLAKAQKLRELLKQERHKDKKVRRSKSRAKEYTLDPSKMTMSDLVHYLPLSNPMTSSLEDTGQENENEIVVPPSPRREESAAQEPGPPPKLANPRDEDEEEEGAEDEQDQDDSLVVPQLKVAEDGSLIIDEESLTVEVLRAKGPNPAQERDPIFERGSTTTYSSFKTVTHTKPWSNEETDMFFLAISMVGTDFSMISQLFPHRVRAEIKNKFKKEERLNSWRIDKAFRERRKLDIEYFSKLLEKILEFQKNKKKLKSLAKKNAPKKRKSKGKKSTSKLSDVDEEEADDANEVPDLDNEEGVEKENEDLCNEGKSSVSAPKKQRKRKTKQADSNEEPKERKRKRNKCEKSSDQAEACIPEDTEAALPEEHPTSDMTEKTENANPSTDTTVKPARLSRGRAPKPLVPLGRKWGKKPPPDPSKDKDATPDNADDDVCDGAAKEQVNKESSPLRQAGKKQSADGDVSSEEETASVQPPRPTRSGRVPKPIQLLNYPAKEDAYSSASDATPGSPVGSTASTTKRKPKRIAKRIRPSEQQSAQVSKKPKLVTLRASQSESEDEDEGQQNHTVIEEEELFTSSLIEDSSAPVFVPASLRSPRPVISQVEETMEEFDILANIPDVLDISQDALCPGVSWEQAQNETGIPEPCEHQLDLLVDGIDFLSSEHQEEDESYNEAVQTLLAIGNPDHLPRTAQNHITENLEESAFQEASNDSLLLFGDGDTETSERCVTVEQQHAITDSSCIPMIKTSDQTCDAPTDPSLQLDTESSKQNHPQTRKGRLSKVKPKPNLNRSSKTAQPKSQPDTRAEQTAEESNSDAANHHQITETLSIPEETIPRLPEFSSTSLTDDISCTKVKLAEKQEGSSAVTSDQSISENHSRCFSDAQFEEGGKQVKRDTQSKSESPAQIIACLSDNSGTPDISVTQTQDEQGSNTDSVPFKEISQHTSAFVTPAEDLPVCQKELTSQSRFSQLQKVKPKPNIPRTSRTARLTPLTQDTKESADNDSTPIFPNSQEKAIVELELEETCGPSPEKPSHIDGPAAALKSSFDPESTLSSTMESSTTEEEKRTDDGLVGQLHSAATSAHSGSENQTLSDVSFKPSSRDTGSIVEKGATQDQPAERRDDVVTSHSALTASQAGQESKEHPATDVTPLHDLPVLQKAEGEVKTSCQARRNRLQKVKPKIPQTPRTSRSTPETTKDHNPTPVLEAVESSCVSASTLSTTQELPTSEKEKRTDDGLTGQVFSVASTSGHSVSENQIFSDLSFNPINMDTGSTSAATDQKLLTQNDITENSDMSVTSDSAATESQAGQDLTAVMESSESPATHVTPVEDVSVSRKQVSEVKSISQSRSSRFQKVKPKPNIPQRSRTALLTTPTKDKKGSVEEDSNPTLILKIQEKPILEIEPEGDCGTSPEKPSHSDGPAAALMSSFDPESTLSSTMESSTTEEEKRTEDGLVGQLHSAATSAHSGSENQTFSDVSFKPSSRDTGSTSATIDEKGATQDQPAERSGDLVTSHSAVTASQAGQESKEHPATHVTPEHDLPVLQKAEGEVKTSCQARRNRLQKVKPKIPQTPRTSRSTPETTKDFNPTPVLKAVEASCVSASTLSTTQELPTSEKEKRTDDGLTGQVFSVASTSGHSVSENQIFSDLSFNTINMDTGSTSAATDQKLLTQNDITENSDMSVTTDSAATESQAGQDLTAVMESSENPATHVRPVEDMSVSRKQVSDVKSISQSRSSRFQKVKPKPNIPQRSRTALLTSRTKDKKGSVEEDSNPTPILKIQEKPILEIEPEGDCGTSPEKPSHSDGPATALVLSFDPESTLSSTMESSTTEEKRTDHRLVGQLHFAATSAHSGSENQTLSDVSFKPSSRDTGSTSATIDEKGSTQDQPAERRDDVVTSHSALTASQAGQESKEHPATDVTPLHDLPVLQKAEGEVKTSCQARRNRLQKVKPKIPQTPRTSRSTPETTKDHNPTPVLEAVESSCVSASTLSTTQELPTSEKEKRTDDGLTGQVFSVASTSGHSVSENQIFSDLSFNPINMDTGSTSAATDQKLLTQNDITENSGMSVTSDSAATESQAGQDLTAVTESSENPATHVTPVEDMSVGQKEVSEVKSMSRSRSSRFQKVKPKPNIPQRSRTALLTTPTKDKKGSVEEDSNPTLILKIQEKAILEIEPEGDCGTSPEKPSHSDGPAAALMSSFDPESTLSSTMESSTTEEEKRTDDGLVGQLHSAATSAHSGSENQTLNDVSFKPSSRDTGSTSATIDEKGATQDQPAERSDLVTSHSAVTASQAGQESKEHPATDVTPVRDEPVLQKADGEVKTSCQARRNRLQKVKPKIPQTPRTSRSTPETTKDFNPTPVLEAVESSCISASTLSTTQELPTSEKEKRTDDGLTGQVFSVASTSGHSVSMFSDLSAATDQKRLTQNDTNDIPVTSDSAATEAQDLPAVTESSEDPATHVTPVDPSVNQKEHHVVASTCQPRSRISQKVKFKPNIPQRSRTARLVPEMTKDSNTTPISKLHDQTEVQIEQEVNVTSSENTSQIAEPPSVVITSFDCGSSATTKEMSTTEKGKRTDDDLVGEANTVGATSGQFGSENQNLSDEPDSKDTGSTSSSTDATTQNIGNLMTPDSAPTETQTGQDGAPLQKSSESVGQEQGSELPTTCRPRRGQVEPKPNLAQSSRTKPLVMPAQPEERPSSPTSKPGSTDDTAAEVALPICSVILPVKTGQSTSSLSLPSLEICTPQNTAEELSAAMKQQTELTLNSNSDSSDTKAPQRRRHFPKVKPNFASSTRPTRTKPETKSIGSSNVSLEKQPVDNSQTELNPTDNKVHLESSPCPLNTELDSTQSALDEPERRLSSTHDKSISANVISMATSGDADNQCLLIDSVIENKSSEMSNNDRGDVGPASHEDWKLNMFTKPTESNTKPQDHSTASSGDGHTISRRDSLLASNATSILDTRESSPHPCVQSDAGGRSPEETQLSSETSNTEQTSNDRLQSAQSTDPTHSALSDSSKSSKEPQQTRRGRLVKPKPNLGRGGRPLQPQVQNSTQAEADSEDRDASVSHHPVSELHPDIPEPVEGAVETQSKPACPSNVSSVGCLTQIIDPPSSNDAATPLGCLTQVLDTSSQNIPIFTTEAEPQSHPCLTLFPHMTSEQVPSDQDEPFFILSLTEIPVGPSGDLVEAAAEPLPFAGETSVQQQSSVSGESSAPAGEAPLYHDPVSTPTEEVMCDVDFFYIKDAWSEPVDDTDPIIQNEVEPLENTSVQPSTLQKTVDDQKTASSPPKQKLTRTGRRTKLQTKPPTMRKTRVSKSENTNKDSELPRPSMQPEGSAGSDLLTEPPKSPHPCVQSDAGGRSPEETQLSSETSNTEKTSNDKLQSAQSTDPTHSALSDPSKSSKEAQQTRRGRQIKPKPNLDPGSHPLQPQVQNSTKAEAAKLQAKPPTMRKTRASKSENTNKDSELPRPSMQPEGSAGSDLLTEPPKSPHPRVQSDAGERSPEETQLSSETSNTEQTSNDKLQSAQSTDPTHSALSDSSKSSKDAPQTRRARQIKPKPNLDPGSRPLQPQVQNSTQAEAVKLQAKPPTMRKTRVSKSENTNKDSELPRPSMQPEASAGSDLLTEPQRSIEPENTEKETTAGEDGPEDGRRTRARTQTPRAATRKRSSNTPSSDPPSGKAASKVPKVKTPQTRRKHSKPSPAASPSLHVAVTAGSSQQQVEIHSASTASAEVVEVDVIQQNTEHSQLRSDPVPSTSPCTEVSAPQQSPESTVLEEEPTNVSQYFLSDIFTEVEED